MTGSLTDLLLLALIDGFNLLLDDFRSRIKALKLDLIGKLFANGSVPAVNAGDHLPQLRLVA